MDKKIHPFLILFIPFSFLYTLILVIFYPLLSDFIHFPAMFPVLLVLVGISEIVTGNMLYKERIASILPRLRELVFIILLGFFFIILLNGDLISGNVTFKSFSLWVPLILIIFQWFLCNFVHRKFKDRELFIQFFKDKEESEYGSIFQAHSHEGTYSKDGLVSIKRLLTVFMILTFIGMVIVFWFMKLPPNGIRTFIICMYYISSAVIIATLNFYLESQVLMMNGHKLSIKQRRQRLTILFLLVIMIGVLAVPAVGKKSIMPSSYISTLYDRLENFARRDKLAIDFDAPKVDKTEQTGLISEKVFEDLGGEAEESANLERLKKIITWIFLSLAGALIIWFLLRPIFKSDGGFHPVENLKKSWKLVQKNIKKALITFKEYISLVKTARKAGKWQKAKGKDRIAGAKKKKWMESVSRAGLKERIIHGRFLKAFFKLTKWGEKKGVVFRRTIGPREYALQLEKQVPGLNNISLEIADIFEEILFSHHEMNEERESDFFKKVKIVTREKYSGSHK